MAASRLLPDIVSITPSAYEDFTRCPRLLYCGTLLGVPASDPAPSSDHGLLVHDMLWKIHTSGSCHDDAHVADVLAAHGFDTASVRDSIARHARRCPSQAAQGHAHEHDFARFHRAPAPMFMATARIDAVWVHDGLLDARDYKTGRRFTERVADIAAAHVQAFTLGNAARARGLRLRLRYEYLQAEVDEDPEPWEVDDDTLADVEEELRAAVARMWEGDDWRGVADADVCRTCRYRSICRDSAAPGEPSWPVLMESRDDLDR
ncbi:MAG TPA: PD-(D/E)XK nuclease family protein [Acidimicrobiia bacterium]|nr:PD-(D/E)XK nuclease family protein [Acidimicrobiia bacterium]